MLDWFTKDQHDCGQPRGNSKNRPIAKAAGNPEPGTNPDGRRSGKARHMTGGIAQNYARAEKTDPGENTLQDSADRIDICGSRFARKSQRENTGDCCSEADQTVGSDPGGLAVKDAIQPEKASD